MTTKPDTFASLAAADPRIQEILDFAKRQDWWHMLQGSDLRYLLTRLAEAHAALRRIYELQIDSEDFGTSSPEELYANKLNAIEAIAREGLGHE